MNYFRPATDFSPAEQAAILDMAAPLVQRLACYSPPMGDFVGVWTTTFPMLLEALEKAAPADDLGLSSVIARFGMRLSCAEQFLGTVFPDPKAVQSTALPMSPSAYPQPGLNPTQRAEVQALIADALMPEPHQTTLFYDPEVVSKHTFEHLPANILLIPSPGLARGERAIQELRTKVSETDYYALVNDEERTDIDATIKQWAGKVSQPRLTYLRSLMAHGIVKKQADDLELLYRPAKEEKDAP